MTVGIGIIGCGRAALDLHLPALRRLPGARVVGLAELDPHRLATARREHGIEHGWNSHTELLRHAGVDAVLVATPAAGHAAIVGACLEHEKHVLVEKPLAFSPDEAVDLVRRAESSGVRTAVGHNLRCHRLAGQARELLDEGAVGEVEALFSVWSTDIALRDELPAWRERRASLGGVVHEVAIHHFDLWRYLLGIELEAVVSVSKPGERDDDSTAICCRYSGGVPATMLFSQTTAVQHVIEVWGRKGRLRLDCYRFDGLEVIPIGVNPGDLGTRGKGLLAALTSLPQGLAVARRGGDFMDSYRREWESFLAAIERGSPVACSFDDGLAAVRAAHAAAQAAASGEVVRLDGGMGESRE